MIFSTPETYKRPLGSRKSICVSTSQKITLAPLVETRFPDSKRCAVIALRAAICLRSCGASSSENPTDSLGGDPVLRRLKNDEVVRPASAYRNTVKALEERSLISAGKGADPLTIVWRINTKTKK